MRRSLSLLFLFFVWEVCSQNFPSLLFVLPPPSRIAVTLWQLKNRFAFHSLATLKEMGLGFLLALCSSFPLAWIMLRFKTSRAILQPIFVLIQCIPMFALAPIMVIWFGWGLTAIVVPTALMIFFPLTLNIYQGFRCTPKPLLDFFFLNGASAWQTLLKLRLPSALPHIFAGFRISAAVAGIGAIAGEWAGAQSGLGILMLESRRNSDLEITFGALTCLSCMTLALYGLILLFEQLLHPKRRRGKSLEWRGFVASKKWRFAFFCLLLLLVSCQKKETRLLLDWLPNPNHIPLYAGIAEGFFTEEGINLKVQKQFDQGGGISYLCSKQADLLVCHVPATLKASSHGAKLKILSCLIDRPLRGLIYHCDAKVASPSDLSNKVLGYCIGGPDTSFLDFLLQRAAINPIERKNVSADLISAMGCCAVDFIYGGFWNIEPFQLKAINVKTDYFPIEDLGVPPYAEIIIIGLEKSRETSLEFTTAFRAAMQKSIDFSKAQPELAFAHYLKANPDKSAKTIAWEKEAWMVTKELLSADQTLDFTTLNNFYQWQLEQNILKAPFDLHALLIQ